MPIVNGLESDFDGKLQIVWLNVDDSSTLALREYYSIVRRSSYVLVDGDGEPVKHWFGYLTRHTLFEDVTEFLAE